MHKRFLIALVIAVTSLALSACTSTSNEKFNYVERSVVLPSKMATIYDIQINDSELNIVGFDESNSICILSTSTDKGESWQNIGEFKKDDFITYGPDDNVEMSAYISRGSEVLCVLTRWNDETMLEQKAVLIHNSNKTELEISLPPIDNDINGIWNAEFSSKGDLFIEDHGGQFYKVDKTSGQILCTILPQQYCDIANIKSVNNDRIYVATEHDFKAFSLVDGGEVSVDEKISGYRKSSGNHDDSFGRENFLIAEKNDKKSLYHVSDGGLQKYLNNENQRLLDVENTILSKSYASIYDFVSLDEKNLFLIGHANEKSQLLHYAYEKEKQKSSSDELSVYTLTENRDVDQVIESYLENSPNMSVNKIVGVGKDKNISEKEATKLLIEEIRNNGGPDIIYLDGINRRLISDGLLTDIGEISKDDAYLNNITNSFEKRSASYGVPTKFAPIIIIGNKDIVDTSHDINNLISAISSSGNNKIVDSRYLPNIISLLYSVYYEKDIINNESNLHEILSQFYSSMSSIYSVCDQEQVYHEGPLSDTIVTYVNSRKEMFETTLNPSQISINYLIDAEDLQLLKALKGNDRISWNFIGTKANGFAPMNILSINKNTKNSAEAEKYIEFALSEEGQRATTSIGYPVNLGILEERLRNAEASIYSHEGHDHNHDHSHDKSENIEAITLGTFKENDIIEILSFFKTLTHPYYDDPILADLIFNSIEDYFKGDVSLEEVTKKGVDEIKNYSQELLR